MDFHEFVPRRRNHWFLGNIQTRYGLYHVLCLVRLPQRNYRLEKTSHNRKAFSLTFTQEKELNRKRLKSEFHPASTRNSTRTVRANLWNAFTCSCSLGKLLSRDLFPSSPARTGGTLLAWDHALSQLTLYVSHGKRERNERKKQGSKEKKKMTITRDLRSEGYARGTNQDRRVHFFGRILVLFFIRQKKRKTRRFNVSARSPYGLPFSTGASLCASL